MFRLFEKKRRDQEILKEKMRAHIQDDKLDLNGLGLSCDDIMLVLDILQSNHSITKLDLSRNHISNKGVKTLVNYLLTTDNNITELDLDMNDFNLSGFKELARLIRHSSRLRALGASHNNINIKSAKIMADAVEGNKLLTDFGMASLDISDKCTEHVVRALLCISRNSNLQHKVECESFSP